MMNRREESKSNNKIEFRSRLAQYGTFRCSSTSGGCQSRHSDVIGWYRPCVKCCQQYCLDCSFIWDWSNELAPSQSKMCSCSYCIHRDQLRHCYGSSNDDKGNIGTSVESDMKRTNTSDEVNTVNVVKPSTTSSSSLCVDITMIQPPRYSCAVHCLKCK
jgi:hypothetical protein